MRAAANPAAHRALQGTYPGFGAVILKRFFRKNPALEAADSLYTAAADQARQPAFYAQMGVPDTLEGRFEMTALHVWLILRRLRSNDPKSREVAQKLFDVMFASFDDALRELGVGDLVVGKKVRKLAENFYGRAQAYDRALNDDGEKESADKSVLATALARNVYESDDPSLAAPLAEYVRAAAKLIDDQAAAEMTGGNVRYPEVRS